MSILKIFECEFFLVEMRVFVMEGFGDDARDGPRLVNHAISLIVGFASSGYICVFSFAAVVELGRGDLSNGKRVQL